MAEDRLWAQVFTRDGGGWAPILRWIQARDLKSLFLPEQLNSQSHMLQVGQLVCKTAEAPDFNCPGGLFVDCVGSNFKHGFKFAEP